MSMIIHGLSDIYGNIAWVLALRSRSDEVDPAGIEPAIDACHAAVIPVHHGPLKNLYLLYHKIINAYQGCF